MSPLFNQTVPVGIDISSVVYGRGVSRYTSNLVRSLVSIPQIQVQLYGSSLRQFTELKAFTQSVRHSGAHLDHIPPKLLSWIWQHTSLHSVQSLLPQIQVFHSWDWIQPPDTQLSIVSTIHDLAILKYPESAHQSIVKHHRLAWEKLREKRAHIIAVSRATKKDCIELLGFDESQVHVVHEALPKEVVLAGDLLTDLQVEQISSQLQLDKPYLLFVGTREPRKNLERLIEAWLPLAKDYQLLVAGESGWDNSESFKTKANGQLRFLGKVSDTELAVLYSNAEAFVYPSLYEGFGLPILEAFYYGVPVVTSQTSAMPEVAGNAAEYVDPLSVDSIRAGILTILGENPTQSRARAQKMIVRLHMFSWERVAHETAQVYLTAYQNRL